MALIKGRIDEERRVLLPLVVIASDGMEVELETFVSLDFDGYLAVDEKLAANLGLAYLGARNVAVGFECRLVKHYLGTVLLTDRPESVVVLGGINKKAVIGQRLLAGRKLTVDYVRSEVLLE